MNTTESDLSNLDIPYELHGIYKDFSEIISNSFYENEDEMLIEDIFSSNIEKYDSSIEGDDAWCRLLSEMDKNEKLLGLTGLQKRIEDSPERKVRLLEFLSCKDSFIFLNVGSFHLDFFNDSDIISKLSERLQENKFRFLITAPHKIMLDEFKNNKFVEMLLLAQKAKQGVVVDIGDRIPLHFMAVFYKVLNKPHVYLSFENFHCERQKLRQRITVRSPKTITGLIQHYLVDIIPKGTVRTKVEEFAELNV